MILKDERVVLKLHKVAAGLTWSALDDAKDVKERERQARIDRGDLKGGRRLAPYFKEHIS